MCVWLTKILMVGRTVSMTMVTMLNGSSDDGAVIIVMIYAICAVKNITLSSWNCYTRRRIYIHSDQFFCAECDFINEIWTKYYHTFNYKMYEFLMFCKKKKKKKNPRTTKAKPSEISTKPFAASNFFSRLNATKNISFRILTSIILLSLLDVLYYWHFGLCY